MGEERQRGSKYDIPRTTITVTTYAELHAMATKFAQGRIKLLVVLGEPGKGKSYTVRNAIQAQQPTQDEQLLYALNISLENILGTLDPEYTPQEIPITGAPFVVKGVCSPVSFHIGVFDANGAGVLIDDADDFFGNAQNREQARHLAESEKHKLMIHDKFATQLEDVPKAYYTTSPVCIIRNVWDSSDPINRAIEDRGIFIYFDPTWEEWYQHCGTWFWDQEIFDYVWNRIPLMAEPSIRLLTNAYDMKVADLNWKQFVDSHIAEPEFILMAEYLRKPIDDFGGKEARIAAWVAAVKEEDPDATASRSTWRRHAARIARLLGQPRPERIVLTRNTKPVEICPPLPKRRPTRREVSSA